MRSLNLLRGVFNTRLVLLFLTVLSLQIGVQYARSADHVDAPLTTADQFIDINDVYAFIDPEDSSRLVLAMSVIPFIPPTNNPDAGFSPDVLYQFKIDGDGDAVEELVLQVLFEDGGFQDQFRVLGPAVPESTGAVNQILEIPASISGSTQQNLSQGAFRAYAGLADDAFVADLTQLNLILDGSQDVFRGFDSPVLGPLSGRSVRTDGTSGVDFFGGVNSLHIVVSFPKELVRGDGFFGIEGLIGVWGTASREDNGSPGDFVQIDRMGQELFNTVFVPSDMKDDFNSAVPEDDAAMFSDLVPDTLTQVDNDGTGNTIEGRATLLGLLGVTAIPNGSPLLLPSDFVHPLVPTAELLRIALLPDFIRIDLDRDADDLAIGLFGLQNGRRPQDDTVDIALSLLRQLADVNFPDGSMVPGSGPPRAGALDCTALPGCPDRRVLAVLQGTDWIKPDDQIDALRLDISGNDSQFPASGGGTTLLFLDSMFNFMALILFPDAGGGGGGGSCALAASPLDSGTGAMAFIVPSLVLAYALGKRFRRRKSATE